METRRCPRCGEDKLVDEFKPRFVPPDRIAYQTYCVPCRREYRRNHYLQNKAYYFRKVREQEARCKRMIRAAKARPCTDCGIQYAPWQMDYDHVKGSKRMGLACKGSSTFTLRSVRAEIAKCEVVCANCHRDRTHFRRMAGKGETKPLDPSEVAAGHADGTAHPPHRIADQCDHRKRHYLQHKQEYIRRTREREARIRELVDQAKARPCADCGILYPPWKMDFDHVWGSKVMTISQMAKKKGSIPQVLAEIAKCELVCANCHRNRTYFRRQALKQSKQSP